MRSPEARRLAKKIQKSGYKPPFKDGQFLDSIRKLISNGYILSDKQEIWLLNIYSAYLTSKYGPEYVKGNKD